MEVNGRFTTVSLVRIQTLDDSWSTGAFPRTPITMDTNACSVMGTTNLGIYEASLEVFLTPSKTSNHTACSVTGTLGSG